MPLFARTAPELDLAYSEADLIEGRRHKDATTTAQILEDLGVAIAWLKQRCPQAHIDVVGFCFGGHAALLAMNGLYKQMWDRQSKGFADGEAPSGDVVLLPQTRPAE